MKELHLTKKDFDIQLFSGQGLGGQNRNKTQNCCRIIHKETGLRAQCTAYRERTKNQCEAFRVLAHRIVEHYKNQEERPTINTTVVRTYHEPDNRVKDYASGLQQPYTRVVDGNHIGDMIEARARTFTTLDK